MHLTSCILPDSQLTSTPASSHVLPQNPRSEPKFRISIALNLHHDACFVASTYTECKLRIASILYPRFNFDLGPILGGNRCARRAIAFELYTFVGNDCLYERSAPTLSRRAHSLGRRAHPLSVGTLASSQSAPARSVSPLAVGPLSVGARTISVGEHSVQVS